MEGRFDRNCVEKYLPSNLDHEIIKSNDNSVIVSTTFSILEESHEWITNFGLKSDAQYTGCSFYLYRVKFCCHFRTTKPISMKLWGLVDPNMPFCFPKFQAIWFMRS